MSVFSLDLVVFYRFAGLCLAVVSRLYIFPVPGFRFTVLSVWSGDLCLLALFSLVLGLGLRVCEFAIYISLLYLVPLLLRKYAR